MIIRPSTPTGHVVFCDDIRDEMFGKKTYVGIYAGNLVINGDLPTVLPKLGIAVTYAERPGESDKPVKIVITAPALDQNQVDETLFEAEVLQEGVRDQIKIPEPVKDIEMRLSIQLNIVISPFLVQRIGHVIVKAFRGNDEIRLGVLNLQLAEGEQVLTPDS